MLENVTMNVPFLECSTANFRQAFSFSAQCAVKSDRIERSYLLINTVNGWFNHSTCMGYCGMVVMSFT